MHIYSHRVIRRFRNAFLMTMTTTTMTTTTTTMMTTTTTTMMMMIMIKKTKKLRTMYDNLDRTACMQAY